MKTKKNTWIFTFILLTIAIFVSCEDQYKNDLPGHARAATEKNDSSVITLKVWWPGSYGPQDAAGNATWQEGVLYSQGTMYNQTEVNECESCRKHEDVLSGNTAYEVVDGIWYKHYCTESKKLGIVFDAHLSKAAIEIGPAYANY